jgi:iron complex transport system permease protein
MTSAPRHLAAVLIGTALLCLGLALSGAPENTFWTLRAPRVAAGFVVGALLALSGLALQVLLRNPLADPYVLGTSGGAAVGSVGALVLFGTGLWLGASLGALASGLLLMWLARGALRGVHAHHEDDASARLILTGAMIAAVLGAATTLLLTLTPDNQLRGAIFWLMGDLAGAEMPVLAGVMLGVFLLTLQTKARSVDRLMLGSEAALLLGEPVRALRWMLLSLACVATACAVAVAGTIGFVGLVVPQALRYAGVRSTRSLSWMSAILGGCLLVLADTVARTVAWPLELPVGALMSLIGAPVFIGFLMRGSR